MVQEAHFDASRCSNIQHHVRKGAEQRDGPPFMQESLGAVDASSTPPLRQQVEVKPDGAWGVPDVRDQHLHASVGAGATVRFSPLERGGHETRRPWRAQRSGSPRPSNDDEAVMVNEGPRQRAADCFRRFRHRSKPQCTCARPSGEVLDRRPERRSRSSPTSNRSLLTWRTSRLRQGPHVGEVHGHASAR